MARRKRPLLDFLMNTVQQAQANNRDNPNEETASPKVFDLIKDQIVKANLNRGKGGTTPILDLIKGGIDKARIQNQNDPDQKNAPGAIFDAIKNGVDQFKNQNQKDEFDGLIEEFGINDEAIDQGILDKVEQAFNNDRQRLREAYAQKLQEISRG